MTAHDDEIPAGLSPLAVVALLLRHPGRFIVRRWNHKAAITSAMARGPLFFAANLSAGLGAAQAALVTEFLFRFATSGFYGAITQSFRRAEPAHAATIAAMVLLPVLGHSAELAVHWLRGTPRLEASIGLSVAFTCLTTAFNLFAMRRGALIVGRDSQPLWRDLMQMPRLLAAFLFSWRSRPST